MKLTLRIVKALCLSAVCVFLAACDNQPKVEETSSTNTMDVKFISQAVTDAAQVPACLDSAGVDFSEIASVNWPNEFPYKPDVKFRIAYSDAGILLHYRVTEQSIRARFANDNDSVWTDCCVEFFSQPEDDGYYYNLECNCIGTVLCATGNTRNERTRATEDVLKSISRWSSLGRDTFEEIEGEKTWELALIVPTSVYFKHNITSLAGKTFKANFYKCGDALKVPHFVSWNPINIEKPDFHRPDFFGEIHFVAEK